MTIPPFAVGVMWLAVILGVTAGFFVLVRKLRTHRGGPKLSANQLLADFRELHEAGELSDAEYRRIRTRLAPQLTTEAASVAGGATTIAEAADALRGVAETFAAGLGVEGGGVDPADRRDPAGGAEREGCDAAPPDGGDSTEGDR